MILTCERYWACDLDGVICSDHPPEIGPEEYEKHIDYAKPLYVPRGFVVIVTGRITKYHDRTERWLDRHGLNYLLITKPDHLRGIDKTPIFKAGQYLKCGAELFIESHTWQARVIANLSGRPVFSMENFKILQPAGPKGIVGGDGGY